MKKWEKIFFWILTAYLIGNNILWKWVVKLFVVPGAQPIDIIVGSIIRDIILVVVWLYLLIKFYRKATYKD